MRMILLVTIWSAVCSAGSMLGTWRMDRARSRFDGVDHPLILTVRLEPHAKGRVFTLDRLEADGRSTSFSSVLYLDGTSHDFQDFACSGTQSSRWWDGRTIEIRRVCSNVESVWRVRESEENSKDLTIEITEKSRGGSTLGWRVVLKRQ
jgi:hypothetical protein